MKRFCYKHFIFAGLLAAWCLGLAGCGYTARSALPSQYQRIYVEPFKNNVDITRYQGQVYFPLLEVKVRNAVEDRFLFDGNLRISDTAPDADMILKGDLTGYEKEPLRYFDNQDVEEYRIRIIMNLNLKDARTGETIWEENGFVGESTYLLSGSGAISERTAVDNATLDLARRVVERTVENW